MRESPARWTLDNQTNSRMDFSLQVYVYTIAHHAVLANILLAPALTDLAHWRIVCVYVAFGGETAIKRISVRRTVVLRV